MAENIRETEASYPSKLLQKWNELDIKNAAAPLLQFADQHPFITLFIGILAGLSVLPMLVFATFVIMTLMFTLFGFLLIEGTLLSIATFMLAVTLFGVVCAAFVFTAFLVLVWFAAATGSVGMQRLKRILEEQVPQLREQRLLKKYGTDNKTS